MQQYNIYPSLLDSYDYLMSSDSEDAFQQIIDRINRKDQTVSAAAQKGIDLNNVMDDLVLGKKDAAPFIKELLDKDQVTGMMMQELYANLEGSTPQVLLTAEMELMGKKVILYGYADYVRGNRIIDLKTTSKYAVGKYGDGAQHLIYPLCAALMGMDITQFRYLVTDFRNVYREDYDYDFDRDLGLLKGKLTDFISFLNRWRGRITDKKIFSEITVEDIKNSAKQGSIVF